LAGKTAAFPVVTKLGYIFVLLGAAKSSKLPKAWTTVQQWNQ